MNRRQFLASLIAVPLVAKTMMVTSHSPAAVEGELIDQILKTPFDGWTIHFPDGQIFQFQGVIASIKRTTPIDSLVTDIFEVRPTGPMEVLQGSKQHGTTVSREGALIGDITEIQAPMMTRDLHEVWNGDGDCELIPGLKRLSPMSFTVLLESE